jgi:hypothetical protein
MAELEQLTALKPVVRRRFRPRTYAIGSVLFLIAAVQVVIVLAVDGADNPLWLWLAAPIALGGGGIALAYKSIPFEHVRFQS